MKNKNLLKWAAVGVVVLGLSGCSLDGSSQQESTYSSQEYSAPASQNSTAQGQVKKQASAEPVQKTTPGPKRAAAPQLPVIE